MAREGSIFLPLCGGFGILVVVAVLLAGVRQWNRNAALFVYYASAVVLVLGVALVLFHAIARIVADCSDVPRSHVMWLLALTALIPGVFPFVLAALLVWTAVRWASGSCVELPE